MEALVILLAEFLTLILLPAVFLVAEIAAFLLTLLLELTLWLLFGRRRAASRTGTVPSNPPGRGWKDRIQSWNAFSRPIRNIALVGLALTIGSLVLVNALFFEPSVRLAVSIVGKRTGTELEFKSVSGDLFTGRFAFEDISARRVSETKSSFNLKVRNLSADIDLPTLIYRPVSFETLSVDTVSGTFYQPEKQKIDGNVIGGGQIRAKRKFRVEDLTLRKRLLPLVPALPSVVRQIID